MTEDECHAAESRSHRRPSRGTAPAAQADSGLAPTEPPCVAAWPQNCRGGGASCVPGRRIQQAIRGSTRLQEKRCQGHCLSATSSKRHQAPTCSQVCKARACSRLPSTASCFPFKSTQACAPRRDSADKRTREGPSRPGSGASRTGRRASWPHVSAGSFKCRDHTGRSSHTRQGAATRSSCQAAPRPPQEPCRSHPRGARQSEAQAPPRQGGEGRSGRGGLATPASRSEPRGDAAWAPRGSQHSETVSRVPLHPDSSLPPPSPSGCELGLRVHP